MIKLTGTAKGEVIGLAPGQPEYRILIVEDQKESQILLRQLMENVGCSVKVADDGKQGVKLYQSWHPHLIWMDRRMPVMDGMEAAQRIRELPGGKDVKIIAVTASALLDERGEILSSGMDDFVLKPYRFNEIYDCMVKHLGVQYIYQDTHEEKTVTETMLTKQALSVLPSSLRESLRSALTSLESEAISAAVKQVTSYDEGLYKTMLHYVDDYNYPAILNALQTD